ncbi:zeta toxin family protein [Streptomyces sp. NPDC020719]|uniref:zeta toxin family protein n=1 Tax=Streptomyces sp. NPDC020719 TaxID=3154896 RepID=UPI0033EEC836
MVLTEAESAAVLARIAGEAARGAVRQERPVVVFVLGQPGSGERELAAELRTVLGRRGGAVLVDSAAYAELHRYHAALVTEDPRTAAAKVEVDVRRWQQGLEEYVRGGRFDAVVTMPRADPAQLRGAAGLYRRAGYRVEVVALATPVAWSQLSAVTRVLDEAPDGSGWLPWDVLDSAAERLPALLAVVEAEQLAEHVLVVRPGMAPLYANELAGGVWRQAPAAGRAVMAEWERWWDAQESARFGRALTRADRRAHQEQLPQAAHRLVVHEVGRAAALSEPVRRRTQALAMPPGVDHHRLSEDEHRFIFDELIVPAYLSGITAQERPTVVFLLGQPGAGKSRMSYLIRRAFGQNGAARITGDDFKAAHPDYLRLLEQEPRTAGTRIRGDYTSWQRMAEAYVRDRRGHAIVEAAPATPEQFFASARPYARAGYTVELVVLAVRAADSRQGTADRYASAVQGGIPARFTTAVGHDVCFAALPGVVQAAEHSGLVSRAAVVRRDATALYRNECTARGMWRHRPTAPGVLVAEQHRPYTLAEADRFLALHRRLADELPQHRADLARMLESARPLLPARYQPRPLPRAATRALPAPYVGAMTATAWGG